MGGKPEKAGKKELLVRGSLYTMRRKCGKENCRCRDGEPHETEALAYSIKGHLRILTLRPEDVPRVREALKRYREAKADLETEAVSGIARLRSEIEGAKGRRG